MMPRISLSCADVRRSSRITVVRGTTVPADAARGVEAAGDPFGPAAAVLARLMAAAKPQIAMLYRIDATASGPVCFRLAAGRGGGRVRHDRRA